MSEVVSHLDPLAVANWFLNRVQKDSRNYTQLQLNKLVFIAHGYHLGAYGRPFINDRIVAWKHGPVVPTLRDEFRCFGSEPISRLGSRQIDWDEVDIPELGFQATSNGMLEWIYRFYGSKSAAELIALTHKDGSPWATVTRNGTDIGHNRTIPDEIIQRYYERLLFTNSSTADE